ncbi:hypothetical protein Lal_00029801 [Lupinus albus]|nr:hypothetical protein Lal_00029801 [Lupinus albus]
MTMEKKVVGLLLSMMILSLLDGTSKASQINDITCAQAGQLVLPCVPFLQGIGSEPSASCCSGAKSVVEGASSTQNRRDLCQCLKKVSSLITINPDRAKQLPKLCNVNLPFDLDPKIDCNS